MLEYKAARSGRAFGKVNRFAPTSQMCSACGRIDGPKPLNVRSWTCTCGAAHDRDVNAAINVLAQGRWDNPNACGAQVRPALVPAPCREAGIHPNATGDFMRGAAGISALWSGENVNSGSAPTRHRGACSASGSAGASGASC
ncbi:transposase [Micromonospora coerulea]|uniref:transposase n=1 Tax=Micromonospora coerulea TaxID=47856 RepID=UPI001F201A53|nr:transposase [Micromonospora veneta]